MGYISYLKVFGVGTANLACYLKSVNNSATRLKNKFHINITNNINIIILISSGPLLNENEQFAFVKAQYYEWHRKVFREKYVLADISVNTSRLLFMAH